MARYTFVEHVEAPVDLVFELWTDLDRMREWVGGVTRVTGPDGPTDRVGTRYTTWFGSMASETEVIEAERPRLFATRFRNRLLRGVNRTTLEPEGAGTRLSQTFDVDGLIPNVMARIFATGSYKGSFRGELREFVRIAEVEARKVAAA
jgi:uncharacterized protein YndB with AHSA1/START domain